MSQFCINSISRCLFCCPIVPLVFSCSAFLWYSSFSASLQLFCQCSGVLSVFCCTTGVYHGAKGSEFHRNSMLWLFGFGILLSRLFVLWKNALESWCCGFVVSISWCCGVLVPKSKCHSFLALESRCRDFLVLESWCRGICDSTALFSFSLNLLST